MDWIFDHLQVVIAIAAALAYWFNNQRKRAGDEAEPQDVEERERTRRIQEEIRRKIAERRAGQAPASTPAPARREAPPPLLRPRPAELPMPPFGAPPHPVFAPRTEREERHEDPTVLAERQEESARTAAQTAAILERQEQLAAEMRALEVARVEARKRAAQVAAAQAETVAREQGSARSLVADLRDAKNLRRAVVLREVLNAPVGLR